MASCTQVISACRAASRVRVRIYGRVRSLGAPGQHKLLTFNTVLKANAEMYCWSLKDGLYNHKNAAPSIEQVLLVFWKFNAVRGIDAAPPPLWRAHHLRVAVATSHRPSRPLSSLDGWLPIPLMKHAAVAGSVSSRDRAGELRQVIR